MIYFGYVALRHPHPAWLVAGVLVVTLIPVTVLEAYPFYLGLQFGLMFLTVWQLRWADRFAEFISHAQWLVAGAWTLQCYVWVQYEPSILGLVEAESAMMLGCAWLARRFRGHWGPLGLTWGSVAGLGPTMLDRLLGLARQSPAGLICVIGAFVLLGAGTWLAWNQYRWIPAAWRHRPPASPAEPEVESFS